MVSIKRVVSCPGLLLGVFLLFSASASAQNLVPNPELAGAGGVIVGDVIAPAGIPDSWRAFAVAGGAIEVDVAEVLADEIFDGSPATNAVCFRVNTFGGDQGFDDDNGRFALAPGVDYHAEFWVRSGNTDASDQTFNFGFPIFKGGVYLGREPGGKGGLTATSEWQQVVGPIFRDSETDQGHISWRCIEDGGENSICIALPAVLQEADQLAPPAGLSCVRTAADVELTWQNNGEYDNLQILRDGAVIAELAPDDASYLDEDIEEGVHTYQVVAVAAGLEDGPSCEVRFVVVVPGTTVRVDLNDLDIEDGLVNSQRQDGTDGENEFVLCGPETDLREARSNWASADPTPDAAPDGLFYFNVTDPDVKAQGTFVLKATVYDDPALAGVGLYLQYTNADSAGPIDFPNTFFPLEGAPTLFLEGTGEWVELSWPIENAGFRSFQQGSSDFRIGVTDDARVCMDRVELIFGEPGPADPMFHRGDVDGSGGINLTDPVNKLNFLFLGGPAPACLDAADANDDGVLNITGAIYLLNWLFLGGPGPLPPGPQTEPCGPDTTADAFANAECTYAPCAQ